VCRPREPDTESGRSGTNEKRKVGTNLRRIAFGSGIGGFAWRAVNVVFVLSPLTAAGDVEQLEGPTLSVFVFFHIFVVLALSAINALAAAIAQRMWFPLGLLAVPAFVVIMGGAWGLAVWAIFTIGPYDQFGLLWPALIGAAFVAFFLGANFWLMSLCRFSRPRTQAS